MSHDPNARNALITLNAFPMEPLGNPRKVFVTKLTEPEINAIYAAVAFTDNNCSTLVRLAGGDIPSAFWEHYGPTLNALVDRLQADFDGK